MKAQELGFSAIGGIEDGTTNELERSRLLLRNISP